MKEEEMREERSIFEDSPSNLRFILSSPALVTMEMTDERNRAVQNATDPTGHNNNNKITEQDSV